MKVIELMEYSKEYVADFDALMHDLAPGAEATVERLLNDAKDFGVQTLHLTSNPKRVAANRLYQALGFERYDTNCYKL